MKTVTAIAHPNIALVKYWGKRDLTLNLPATPSVSLTLAPFRTKTTVTWGAERDKVTMNGTVQEGPPRARVIRLLDLVDPDRPHCTVVSDNDFPTGAGLASSSSGFAALAVAASSAAGQSLDPVALSLLARRGSGSACRSIWGGFVTWPLGTRDDGLDCHGVPLDTSWDLAMVVALVSANAKETSSTAGMLQTQRTSPMYRAWVDAAPADFATAVAAIEAHDLEALGVVMERSTLKMHATMWTADPPLRYLRSGSVRVLERVEELRAAGVGAWVTMDAGPNVKVLCEPSDAPAVVAALGEIGLPTTVLGRGGAARVVDG